LRPQGRDNRSRRACQGTTCAAGAGCAGRHAAEATDTAKRPLRYKPSGAVNSGRRCFSCQLVANGFLPRREPEGALGGTISVGMPFTEVGVNPLAHAAMTVELLHVRRVHQGQTFLANKFRIVWIEHKRFKRHSDAISLLGDFPMHFIFARIRRRIATFRWGRFP
jgi:hypothetical protein